MNKNIKEEFNSLINDQTPDLWSRIEASLPEKNIAEAAQGEKSPEMTEASKVTRKEQGNKPLKSRLYRKYAVYGTVGAAACLCIALFALQQNSLKSDNSMDMADTTAEETAEAPMEDAAQEMVMADEAESGWEESEGTSGAMEDSVNAIGNTEEAALKDDNDMEEKEGAVLGESSQYAADESAAESDFSESMSGEERKTEEVGIENKIQNLKEQGLFVFENVSLRVDSVTESVQDGKAVLIYHVTVLQDAEYIEKDQKIDLKADELFQEKLAEGESYHATFYDNKAPYDSSIHEYFILKIM